MRQVAVNHARPLSWYQYIEVIFTLGPEVRSLEI
jgi:hypothetical protein